MEGSECERATALDALYRVTDIGIYEFGLVVTVVSLILSHTYVGTLPYQSVAGAASDTT